MDKCLLVALLVIVAVMVSAEAMGGYGGHMAGHGGPLIIPYPLKIPFLGGEGHYTYSDKKSSYGGGGYGGHNVMVGHGGPLIIPQPITWVDQHHEYAYY